MEWVSVVSLIISTVISGGIGYFFKRKFEKDRRKFERDRDKLKREFEKDLLSIKTNFEKEIYTYKARYDHKVKMVKEMFELIDRFNYVSVEVYCALDGELHYFPIIYRKWCAEYRKCDAFFWNHRPFEKKEVIENFKRFYRKVVRFVSNVYVFWYERKFLIEKDKNLRYKYDNTDCEDLRRDYETKKDVLSQNSELIEFRDVDDIKERHFKLRDELMTGLSEQIREYLNEK